jgi:hypothetical protein
MFIFSGLRSNGAGPEVFMNTGAAWAAMQARSNAENNTPIDFISSNLPKSMSLIATAMAYTSRINLTPGVAI